MTHDSWKKILVILDILQEVWSNKLYIFGQPACKNVCTYVPYKPELYVSFRFEFSPLGQL